MINGYGKSLYKPAESCMHILNSTINPASGYYWVKNATGHPHRVYCDMTRSCGGVTGGWTRVAYLDMRNSKHRCPSGLRQRTDSNIRTCAAYSDPATCSSISYPSSGVHYSKVCGFIRGYHYGSMNGFRPNKIAPHTVDYNYVDGISLTHGRAPRHHIWTFAVFKGECPCKKPPVFVENDYFCDTRQMGNLNKFH